MYKRYVFTTQNVYIAKVFTQTVCQYNNKKKSFSTCLVKKINIKTNLKMIVSIKICLY